MVILTLSNDILRTTKIPVFRIFPTPFHLKLLYKFRPSKITIKVETDRYMLELNSMKIYILMAMLSLFTASYAQSLNNSWKQDLTTSLQQFLNCQSPSERSADCNQFMGESLNKVYKINDFYSRKSGRYMVASEIASFLKESDNWTLLGHSYEQKTLATAQDLANSKKAVVAVYMNATGVGHVVIITPGQLQNSGSWGLNVPNVVSFFPSQPEKSFVDKGLSFAFGKNLMKDILIYSRNY